MTTWKETAARVIRTALAEAEAAGLDREETIRRVDAAYPFGKRAYYPYKAWFAARREILFGGKKPSQRDLERLAEWNRLSAPREEQRHGNADDR